MEDELSIFAQNSRTKIKSIRSSYMHPASSHKWLYSIYATITCFQKKEWNLHQSSPMNRIKETVRVIGQPGRLPYRIVRSIIKGTFPLDFPMDSKAISNFIVKCRVYTQMMNDGITLNS